MAARRWLVGAAAALIVGGAAALAHVRLQHPTNRNPLFWSDPTSIGVVIQSAGSDDLPDGSHRTALRNAIAAWNQLAGTRARLAENTSPDQQARTDWQSNDIHLLAFDENNSSGYFPIGSSTVAVTPIWFFSGGSIADADVLFNGRGFSFTTSGEAGRFDVQDIAAHELGHLLGLDHSGWAGATMYPYVDSSMILHRSLSDDELRGMRDAYPQVAFGVLRGRIRRASDSSTVAGAHVVARDALGRTRAGGLTSSTGTFVLKGLDAGTYEVYAHPLDRPVGASNFGAGWTIQTDFGATVFGARALTAGEDLDLGDLAVVAPVTLSLGRSADVLPLRAIADGSSRQRVLRGAGLSVGSTLVASDPSVTVTPIAWFGTQVNFNLTVPAGSPIGHVDLTVTDIEGGQAILPAALEITPPDPVITLVSPNQGSSAGETLVTLTGANFHPGARVVIGDRIYADGGRAKVLGPNTIELTTRPSSPALLDVVVIDPSGVEGRAREGYQFLSSPSITVVFPAAGTQFGGTSVAVTGSQFLPGLGVLIDGVQQSDVVVESSTRVIFTTKGGPRGGPYVLELQNSDGSSAQAAFSFVEVPDPVIEVVSPPSGPSEGGTLVTLRGSNFTEDHEVWFGANASTGLGGERAGAVKLLDSETLEVVCPARPPGTAAVLVRDPGTGQAGVLASAFTYVAAPGGGGGCYMVPVDGPPDRGQALQTLLALMLLVLALRAVGRRPGPVRVRA